MTHPLHRSMRRALARKHQTRKSKDTLTCYCEKRWKLIYLRSNKLIRAKKTGRLWPHAKLEWNRLVVEAEPLNVLFVCSRNKWRSPTGEAVFRKRPGVSTRSAGTSSSARRTVSITDIQWADLIFVMEEKHGARLRANFRQAIRYKEIHILDIPDDYTFMAAELVELLEETAEPIIRAALDSEA
jgi:predicted protein tyrosine phosphatase